MLVENILHLLLGMPSGRHMTKYLGGILCGLVKMSQDGLSFSQPGIGSESGILTLSLGLPSTISEKKSIGSYFLTAISLVTF